MRFIGRSTSRRYRCWRSKSHFEATDKHRFENRCRVTTPMTAIMRLLGLGTHTASGPAGLRVRPLGASDLAAVERYLLSLAPADRRARFLGDPSDAVIAAHARGLDPSGTILIGASDGSASLIGLAEAYPCD